MVIRYVHMVWILLIQVLGGGAGREMTRSTMIYGKHKAASIPGRPKTKIPETRSACAREVHDGFNDKHCSGNR